MELRYVSGIEPSQGMRLSLARAYGPFDSDDETRQYGGLYHHGKQFDDTPEGLVAELGTLFPVWLALLTMTTAWW